MQHIIDHNKLMEYVNNKIDSSLIKACKKCNIEKPLSEFRSRGGKMKHLKKSYCNKCLYSEHKKWVNENQDKVREYREKDAWTLVKRCARRGISPEILVSTYESQSGLCPICESEISIIDSAIDHNHKTDEFRGVLCKTCNRALGLFKDNPTILMNAYSYLKSKGSYGDREEK